MHRCYCGKPATERRASEWMCARCADESRAVAEMLRHRKRPAQWKCGVRPAHGETSSIIRDIQRGFVAFCERRGLDPARMY